MFCLRWLMSCEQAVANLRPDDLAPSARSLWRSRYAGRFRVGSAPPMPSLGQLARIGKYDFRLPAVFAGLPDHTDALAAERGFGGAELGPIVSVDNRGQNRADTPFRNPTASASTALSPRIWRRLPRRRRSRFPDVTYRVLWAQVRRWPKMALNPTPPT